VKECSGIGKQPNHFPDIPLFCNHPHLKGSLRVFVISVIVILKGPFRCIIDLKRVFPLPVDSNSKETPFFLLVFARKVNVRGIVVYLGYCYQLELSDEELVG
jgi:hypothetical protein